MVKGSVWTKLLVCIVRLARRSRTNLHATDPQTSENRNILEGLLPSSGFLLILNVHLNVHLHVVFEFNFPFLFQFYWTTQFFVILKFLTRKKMKSFSKILIFDCEFELTGSNRSQAPRFKKLSCKLRLNYKMAIFDSPCMFIWHFTQVFFRSPRINTTIAQKVIPRF